MLKLILSTLLFVVSEGPAMASNGFEPVFCAQTALLGFFTKFGQMLCFYVCSAKLFMVLD